MRKLLGIFSAGALLSGCLAECNISYRVMGMENREETLGFVTCKNVCYSFLGYAPICSGTPWKDGKYRDWKPGRDWFEDHATLDNNMKMVRLAADEVGSNRIGELRTELNTQSFWSLFLVNRSEITTTATILKPMATEK